MNIEDKYLIESETPSKLWLNHYAVGIRNIKMFPQVWKNDEKLKNIYLKHIKAEIDYWQSEYEKFRFNEIK